MWQDAVSVRVLIASVLQSMVEPTFARGSLVTSISKPLAGRKAR
jgi:hypothetical protein